MNALVLWLTLATLPPDPRERAVCTSACAKYVTDPKQHARVCQAPTVTMYVSLGGGF